MYVYVFLVSKGAQNNWKKTAWTPFETSSTRTTVELIYNLTHHLQRLKSQIWWTATSIKEKVEAESRSNLTLADLRSAIFNFMEGFKEKWPKNVQGWSPFLQDISDLPLIISMIRQNNEILFVYIIKWFIVQMHDAMVFRKLAAQTMFPNGLLFRLFPISMSIDWQRGIKQNIRLNYNVTNYVFEPL